MKKIIAIILLVGFISVDVLFFHDILKPGEVTTLPQYLTGILSLLVVGMAIQTLRSKHAN